MLVKLWDTKAGKVLFTLDSHEGKEDFFLIICSQIFGMAQFPNPCCCCFFFSHSNSALGLHRLELNENTVNVMHMFFYFILSGRNSSMPTLLESPLDTYQISCMGHQIS